MAPVSTTAEVIAHLQGQREQLSETQCRCWKNCQSRNRSNKTSRVPVGATAAIRVVSG